MSIYCLNRELCSYLCGHLQLVLTEGKHTTECNARIDDIVLSGGDNDKIVTLLEDSAIIGGNVQEQGDDEFLVASTSPSIASHLDLLGPAKDSIGDTVFDHGAQVGLVDDGKDGVGTDEREGSESAILDDKHLVLRITNNCRLVLRDLNDSETLELEERGVWVSIQSQPYFN
jgi:hypothetical protein